MFLSKYKCNIYGNLTSSTAKKTDSSSFPPCKKVLIEKINRTNFVTSIWVNLTHLSPPLCKPEDFGWILKDGKYSIKLYNGEFSPSLINITPNDVIIDRYRA